jgi:CHAT domain
MLTHEQKLDLARAAQEARGRRGGAPAPAGPAKILFLGANPSDMTKLALGAEVREIEQRLLASELRDAFTFEQEWAVRDADLQQCLLRRPRPTIVHFSGHGNAAGQLLLEDAAHHAKPVDTAALARLFQILRGSIRCVVLNACFSEAQARAIAESIDCVVGMTTAVEDAAAINFAGAFYQALGFGESVQTAFDLGSLQIDLTGLAQGDVPRLVCRAGVRAADVFLHEGAPAEGAPADPS